MIDLRSEAVHRESEGAGLWIWNTASDSRWAGCVEVRTGGAVGVGACNRIAAMSYCHCDRATEAAAGSAHPGSILPKCGTLLRCPLNGGIRKERPAGVAVLPGVGQITNVDPFHVEIEVGLATSGQTVRWLGRRGSEGGQERE